MASYLGYTTEADYPGFGCGVLSIIGVGGQEMFIPDIYMGGDLLCGLISNS